MLKNSIITEPTITNDHLRKVQTWAADFMVLPFNYTINLKSEFNLENIVGPSLEDMMKSEVSDDTILEPNEEEKIGEWIS